jgi:hypothetical protein
MAQTGPLQGFFVGMAKDGTLILVVFVLVTQDFSM